MKKFFTALAFAFAVAVFLPAMTCEARSVSVTDLKWILGNWYDSKGNLVLSISNDYKINGCTVLSVDAEYDTAGVYEIKIDEGNRYRTIELLYTGSADKYPEHQMLVMNWTSNNGQALRRTKEPRYFESVGGIYIGMDKNQVVSLYGQPSSVEDNRNNSTWKYNNLGLDLHFELNVVTGITIYPYGNRKFDRTGLSARSSQADFEYKYNNTMSVRGNIDIGHGELIRLNKIRFGNDGVYLGIFTPGYVF